MSFESEMQAVAEEAQRRREELEAAHRERALDHMRQVLRASLIAALEAEMTPAGNVWQVVYKGVAFELSAWKMMSRDYIKVRVVGEGEDWEHAHDEDTFVACLDNTVKRLEVSKKRTTAELMRDMDRKARGG